MTLSICRQNVFRASCLLVASLSNRQSRKVLFSYLTNIFQCRWRVLWPCSSSAHTKATTVSSIPFPLDDSVFVFHLSMHFVSICMALWHSNEQEPGYFILVSLHNTKSARQSSSEHFKLGRPCWKTINKYRIFSIVHVTKMSNYSI
jgi:hypothetical protein